MKHGVNLPNMAEPAALVELAVAAEAAGWDGVFLWDHVVYGDFGTGPFPTVDPWVVLGAVAQATTRVRIGTMVTPLSRRRPWRVAQEVATLDRLSGGRAVLGVGLGWPAVEDFERFGDEGRDDVRAAMLDEALEVVNALWSGEHVRHAGAHFHVEATMATVPRQTPRPPIWVAGMWPNRAPFRRAARWDGVVPMSANVTDGPPLLRPDELASVLEEIRRHRTATGSFEVVLSPHWEHAAAEYAEAGATWLIQSWDAEPGWIDQLRPLIEHGPAGS